MLVLMLFILSLAGVVKLWQKDRLLRAELVELESKLSKIRELKENSEKKLRDLRAADGIEAEARGRFNLKKEGEELVVFMDINMPQEEKKGFWASAKVSQTQIWQKVKNWLGL